MSLPYGKKNSHFVLYSFDEKGEKRNVIEFYNHFFLAKMKIYLKNLKEESLNCKKQIYATPRPIIPSLITNSPLKMFSSNHQMFSSPFRKNLIETNMTPFSASLFIREDNFNKMFAKDEISSKKFEPDKEISEKPNNLLLSKIKSHSEVKQPVLHLKANPKIFSETEKMPTKSLSRSLFEEIIDGNSDDEEK